MIPEGWQQSRLGDLADIRFSNVDKKSHEDEQPVKLCNYTDVYYNSRITNRIPFMHATAKEREVEKFSLQQGDVIITKDSETPDDIAVPSFVSEPLENVLCGYHLTLLRPYEGKASGEYLGHLFNLPSVQHHFYVLANGITRFGLTSDAVTEAPVVHPPLPEQKKIAAILTSVDEAIEKQEAQIAKLQDLKKAMMQELLTQGIGHTEFKDSPVGRIPKGWEVKTLVNLSVDGINNGEFKDPKKVGRGYKLINVFDLYQQFGLEYENLELLDIDQKAFAKKKVEYGDVFFTRSSLKLEGIAYCNVNLNDKDDLIYECHVMRVRPEKDIIEPEFLAIYCRSDRARKYLMATAKHSTMTTIGQSDIGTLPVPIPSIEEQKKILEAIGSIRKSIQIKHEKVKGLNSLKKSLMQDLLTGKVRVNV